MSIQYLLNKKRIIFAGVARDCAKFLPNVLETVSQISDMFEESAFIFLENDSIDSTKKILNDWGCDKKNFILLNMNGLNQLPVRTLRLEYLRNAYVDYIKNDSILRNFDYLIILDMDDVNVNGIDIRRIEESIHFLGEKDDRAAIFCNQNGIYYDMWALRHKTICPKDIWEEVFDYVHDFKVDDEIACHNTLEKRLFCLSIDRGYLEVDSAFGGLGIYKLSYVLKNPNPYLGSKVKVKKNELGVPMIFKFQSCEHVHFHLGIRSLGGRLFIKSNLINGENQGLNFVAKSYRDMIF